MPTYKELICKQCLSPFKRELKQFNQETKRGRMEFYCSHFCHNKGRIDEHSSFRGMFTNSKKHARKIKKEYELSLEDFRNLWEKQKGICSYTGLTMTLGTTCNNSPFTPTTASLDRIDSDKGYTRDNVEFVCLFINYGKNGFTKKEVEGFLHRMKSNL